MKLLLRKQHDMYGALMHTWPFCWPNIRRIRTRLALEDHKMSSGGVLNVVCAQVGYDDYSFAYRDVDGSKACPCCSAVCTCVTLLFA